MQIIISIEKNHEFGMKKKRPSQVARVRCKSRNRASGRGIRKVRDTRRSEEFLDFLISKKKADTPQTPHHTNIQNLLYCSPSFNLLPLSSSPPLSLSKHSIKSVHTDLFSGFLQLTLDKGFVMTRKVLSFSF